MSFYSSDHGPRGRDTAAARPIRIRRAWLLPAALRCALVVSAALSGGCQAGGPRPATAEQNELRRRAEDLLVRAGLSEVDVVRVNAIEALVQVLPEAGLPGIRESLGNESPLVRYAACVALGELRDRATLPKIRPLIAESNPRVRLAAAFAATRCGESNNAAVLVETMNGHPDENLRADAAYLIGKLGEKKALKRLRLAAKRERSGRVLMHIYTAMAMLGDEYALDRLMEAAVSSDVIARLIALQSLTELASPRSRDALLYRFQQEGDYDQVRLMAARGLGRLGAKVGYDLAVKSLRRQESDPNETMRIRSLAALALGAIGDARALPLLAEVAADESDPRTQVAASLAICQIARRK
ncbi:MAG: HEAT repeat domain-containing protein [Phycisphaerae bacterium]|jgi:HEAT repeat protein